jgi:uncharacterized protein YlxP (DUF503 family)
VEHEEMIVGMLQVEVHLPNARSLKDKRSVLKSVRDQLRGRFNVAVAEVDSNDTWQRATLGLSTVGDDRAYLEGLLRQIAEWFRATRQVDVLRIDEEYL